VVLRRFKKLRYIEIIMDSPPNKCLGIELGDTTEPEKLVGMNYNEAWLRAGGAPAELRDGKLEMLLLPSDKNHRVETIDEARDIALLAGCYEPNLKVSDGKHTYVAPINVDEGNKPGLLERLKTKHPLVIKRLLSQPLF
jgi:hypothetical protein